MVSRIARNTAKYNTNRRAELHELHDLMVSQLFPASLDSSHVMRRRHTCCVWATSRHTLLRANPSKDGDAEPRDYREIVAKSAGPPATRDVVEWLAAVSFWAGQATA